MSTLRPTPSPGDLTDRIEALAAEPTKGSYSADDMTAFEQFRRALSTGQIRAAERDTSGAWRVNAWVKRGILLGFRMGRLVDQSGGGLAWFDKHTYPLRPTKLEDNVRIVPGGSSVRDGAYVAPGVVIMPPAYVNVGAYVDEQTMIDSHVLVGSCAQIGKRVHLSAAAQVGGVLEPASAVPVVIEDDCFIGGGCGIYEGAIVRRRAVLAAGVILTGSTAIHDLVRGEVYRRSEGRSLEVPEGAVVVPGNRRIESDHARRWGISVYAPVIVKYRDEKTDAATILEQALR
jgi:2,3,4,5-tetrahydropyridine-2-carboxylate N-succinyltransferase